MLEALACISCNTCAYHASLYIRSSPGVPKARQNKSQPPLDFTLNHDWRHRAGGDSYRIPPPRHRPEGVSQPAVQITPVPWIPISQKWDDEWWSVNLMNDEYVWFVHVCLRVCSGVVGWLAFTSGLGDVIAFPYLLGSSLTIAACFEGADEALYCIWRCSNHQAGLTCFFFFQGPNSWLRHFPGPSENPLDSQGDARGICSNLSCLFGRRRRHRETYQVATHSVATNGPLAQSHFGWRSLVSGMRWIFVCHYRALDCLWTLCLEHDKRGTKIDVPMPQGFLHNLLPFSTLSLQESTSDRHQLHC